KAGDHRAARRRGRRHPGARTRGLHLALTAAEGASQGRTRQGRIGQGMMPIRAGLYLRDERLTVVVYSGRRRPLQCFALERGDMPGARLKSELETRRLKVRRLRIGLARPLLTVKTLDLPPTRGAQLTEMVAFELERHVPFPPEDIRFDFVALPRVGKGPLRGLVAACERRTVE